jgi:hypothetical protein
MAMTPYTGETSIIGGLGTSPQERGLTTQQFKDKFDENTKNFVAWFNTTHLADIAAHVNRKNLLHNWDFRNPVNQRGLTSAATSFQNAYTLDRWKLMNSGTIAVNSGYITVAGTGSYIPSLRQIVETARVHFAGKEVTFSAYVKGSCKVGIAGSYGDNYTNLTDWTLVKRTITLTAEGGLYVDISALDVNGSFDVLCAKLELGDTSTLANDPPADYGEQLALCQRYYWKIGKLATGNRLIINSFNAGTTTYSYFNVMLPQPMRVSPTLAVSLADLIYTTTTTGAGSAPTSLDIYSTNFDNSSVTFRIGGEFTVGTSYNLWQNVGTYIELSADL